MTRIALAVLVVLASAAPAAASDKNKGFHVPPGHLPPPGMCRIWYLDRPPGHQPPPGPCNVLAAHIPHLDEVSIGHGLTADALEYGMAESVRRFRRACGEVVA